MPSLGIHMAVAEETLVKLRSTDPAKARIASANLPFYLLGSIGPDLAYAPTVMTTAFVDGIRTATRFFQELTPDLSSMSDQKIVEVTEDIVRRSGAIVDGLTSSLLAAIAGLASVIQPILLQRITLEHPTNFKEEFFDWSDFMHYRNNGDFASALEAEGVRRGSDQLRAFAYGFVSHMATDGVGHAFTNHVVGGPFRSRPTFHHVAEQHMDASFWQTTGRGNICRADLHTKIKVHSTAKPDDSDALPRDFVEGFDAALQGAFAGPLSRVTFDRRSVLLNGKAADDGIALRERYALMFNSLEFTTRLMHVDRPVDPKTLGNILQDLADLGDPLLDHGRDIVNRHQNWIEEHFSGSRFTLDSLLDALEDLGEDLLKDIEDLVEAAGEILATGGTIAARGIVAILYLIQLKVYELWRKARLVPVAMGLLYPEPDEILPEWHTVIQMPVRTDDAGAAEILEGWIKASAAAGGMTAFTHAKSGFRAALSPGGG